MALTVLACYDISEDDRRAKVAARLQRHGDRVQYSVFLCLLSADDLSEMVAEIGEIIDPDEDCFFVARQCATCWDARTSIGQSHPPTPELYWAVF